MAQQPEERTVSRRCPWCCSTKIDMTESFDGPVSRRQGQFSTPEKRVEPNLFWVEVGPAVVEREPPSDAAAPELGAQLAKLQARLRTGNGRWTGGETMTEPSTDAHGGRSVWHLGCAVMRELLSTVLPAVLFALFINVYVAEAAMVKDGPSMQPNLYVGYRVMTEKVSYCFREPRRGDVVVVRAPGHEVGLIKRVVAVPGETVALRGGHVLIDGVPVEEPQISFFGGGDTPAQVVPEGHVYIVGDNRPNSRDSRAIGPVPEDWITGRAIFIYWPLEAAGLVP